MPKSKRYYTFFVPQFQAPQVKRSWQLTIAFSIFLPVFPLHFYNCQNLYFLSSLTCQLSNCLDEKELGSLAAELTVLGDMIVNLLAHTYDTLQENKGISNQIS